MVRSINARPGAVTPLVVILLIVLLGMVAFAIDIGYIALAKTELQATADAASLAAAAVMKYNKPAESQSASIKAAKDCAALNTAGTKVITLADGDIEFGNWDSATRVFQKDKSKYNAVRVRAYRDPSNAQGPLPLFFGSILGRGKANVYSEAVALAVAPSAGSRFLIDDEMFDTDVPAIEAVAKKKGVSPDKLLGDADGDWFIDLHKYNKEPETIELPTGQIGDEALHDIQVNVGKPTLPQFPFTQESSPSLKDFLNYNEDSSSWRYKLMPTSKLDPLKGVGRFNDHTKYAGLVNPDFVHVSPIWRSDVSALDSVGSPAKNGVNALGLRRGLIAFRIVGVGKDIDGSTGSYLPNLIIQVVDPKTIQLDEVILGSSGGSQNVRLAN